jgi:NAD(P)-dependent dehydrogenase (short-subunit alcohol dehydrogenase family)
VAEPSDAGRRGPARRRRAGAGQRVHHPRQATPEEIADFILFAASDQARFATFSEILADGGLMLGPVA